MRIFRIVNAIPNDHSNETNFDTSRVLLLIQQTRMK